MVYAESALPTSGNYTAWGLVYRYFQRTPWCTLLGARLKACHVQAAKTSAAQRQPPRALGKYMDASLFSLILPSPALFNWRKEVEEGQNSWQPPSSLQGLEPQFRNELQGELMLGIVNEI